MTSSKVGAWSRRSHRKKTYCCGLMWGCSNLLRVVITWLAVGHVWRHPALARSGFKELREQPMNVHDPSEPTCKGDLKPEGFRSSMVLQLRMTGNKNFHV